MSAGTMDTAPVLDLAGYLDAVRRELGDLGADEVDELTGGLEADLADALAGSEESPVEVFGPPSEYAAELRAAAGLPLRVAPDLRGIRWRRADLRNWLQGRQNWLPGRIWWPQLRGLLLAARPVWWAFRALVVYQVLAEIFTDARQMTPTSGFGLLVLLVLVVLSIEVGRRDLVGRDSSDRDSSGRDLVGRGLDGRDLVGRDSGGWDSGGRDRFRRTAIVAMDLLAAGSLVIAAWSVLIQASSQLGPLPVRHYEHTTFNVAPVAHEDPPTKGVVNSGYPVLNIFPYDTKGNLLQGVQLYDDKGRMLEPSEQSYEDENFNTVDLVPALGTDGQPRYNVYPLRERIMDQPAGGDIESSTDGGDGGDGDGESISTEVRDARAPSRSQYPVITVPTPEATSESTPGSTPGPTTTTEPK